MVAATASRYSLDLGRCHIILTFRVTRKPIIRIFGLWEDTEPGFKPRTFALKVNTEQNVKDFDNVNTSAQTEVGASFSMTYLAGVFYF